MDLLHAAHAVVHQAVAVGLVRRLTHTGFRQLLSGEEIAGGVKLESAIQLLQRLVGFIQGLVPSGVVMQDFLKIFMVCTPFKFPAGAGY